MLTRACVSRVSLGLLLLQAATTNVCVFAGDQVDRSPTGSGVTARVAVHAAKGLVRDGQVRTFRSVVGSTFTGAIASHCTAPGGGAAVTVRVQGEGFYCGEARFTLDDGDELGRGFLVRP
jgi:proline racemase